MDEHVLALPESFREIITLIYYLGLSEEEAAEELRSSISEIRARLSVGLVRVARTMESFPDQAP